MPRTAVITNPEGSFAPEWIHFAITRAMNLIMVVQIICHMLPLPLIYEQPIAAPTGKLDRTDFRPVAGANDPGSPGPKPAGGPRQNQAFQPRSGTKPGARIGA